MVDDDGRRDVMSRKELLGDRAAELRRAVSGTELPKTNFPPTTRLPTRVDRTEEQRAEREQLLLERKAAFAATIKVDLSQTRRQHEDAIDPHELRDEIQKGVSSGIVSKPGLANKPEVVRAFESESFQKLYASEKLAALRELETLFARLDRRNPATVDVMALQKAAASGWASSDVASYDHEDNAIVILDDLLQQKDVRELLRPFFQLQKHAEQCSVLQHADGPNIHSPEDAKRLEMLQNAAKELPRHLFTDAHRGKYEQNFLRQEAREDALKLLEAYDRIH